MTETSLQPSPPPPSERPYLSQVRRKAERMSAARRDRSSFWSQLVHVGVLGWVFVLPVVIGAFAGRWLARATGSRGLALVPLLAGLVIGGYVVWRQVRTSIEKQTNDAEGGEEE